MRREYFIAFLTLAFVACITAGGGGSPQNMFSEPEKYDRFMGRWSRRLAPVFIRFVDIKDGNKVLDVGSGTGSVAFAIAAAAPHSEVVGIDPARGYVEHARAHTADSNLKFEVGDAQQLRFADGSFDVCVSSLVINFIPDARKALAEMRRVTKPGGTIAACVWDYGEGMSMLRTFWDAAVALNPAAERKDERHMPYCRQGELRRLWIDAGLRDVEETGLTIPLEFASFDDYWLPFLDGQGPAGTYVAGLPPAGRAALAECLRKMLLPDGGDKPFNLNARAWAVRGRAPNH